RLGGTTRSQSRTSVERARQFAAEPSCWRRSSAERDASSSFFAGDDFGSLLVVRTGVGTGAGAGRLARNVARGGGGGVAVVVAAAVTGGSGAGAGGGVAAVTTGGGSAARGGGC